MSDADEQAPEHERGPAGDTGEAGPAGPKGSAGISRGTKVLAGIMLALLLVISGGTLVSQRIQQNSFERTITAGHAQRIAAEAAQAKAQKVQGELLEAKLCSIFMPIATLKAPAGEGASNPSRLFEQQLEARLAQVAPALGCKK